MPQQTARIIKFAPVKKKRKQRVGSKVTPNSMIRDRLIFKLQHEVLRGMTVKEIVESTEKSSDYGARVSQSAIRKWYLPVRDGGTRFPRAHTMERVALAHGFSLEFRRVTPAQRTEIEMELTQPRS